MNNRAAPAKEGVLSADQIQVDPSSYVDPQGFLFRHDNRIFRCIRAAAAPLFARLMGEGVLDALTRGYGLIPTKPAELALAAETGGLVVEHPEITPLSYVCEWPPTMHWEAARVTLELALELADHNLVLQDAYPWNVLFDGANAVFVDLTSIAEPPSGLIWPAHEQYESYFWRPLMLVCEGKGQAVRAILANNVSGIGLEVFATLASPAMRARHPGIAVSRMLERRLLASPRLKHRAQAMAERAGTNVTPAIRKRFLQRLRRRLDRLRRQPRGDCWTGYYSKIPEEVDKQAKLAAVSGVVRRAAPATVLDLGCNTGVFSIEAAKGGARVFAVDSSESCVELLFHTARDAQLAITPLIADIACPTPAGGFLARQYPPLFERVRAEAVLCLGLMHHLHIAARQPFERIARLMNEVCMRLLVFEFVDRADPNNALLPSGRMIDYTLESVQAALGAWFAHIETHPSDRPTRKLLVCEK